MTRRVKVGLKILNIKNPRKKGFYKLTNVEYYRPNEYTVTLRTRRPPYPVANPEVWKVDKQVFYNLRNDSMSGKSLGM